MNSISIMDEDELFSLPYINIDNGKTISTISTSSDNDNTNKTRVKMMVRNTSTNSTTTSTTGIILTTPFLLEDLKNTMIPNLRALAILANCMPILMPESISRLLQALMQDFNIQTNIIFPSAVMDLMKHLCRKIQVKSIFTACMHQAIIL